MIPAAHDFKASEFQISNSKKPKNYDYIYNGDNWNA